MQTQNFNFDGNFSSFQAHAVQNHPKSAVLFQNFKENVECDVSIKDEVSVSDIDFTVFRGFFKQKCKTFH